MNEGEHEPGTGVTFDKETLKAIDRGKLRVGQPTNNWYKTTLNDLWVITKTKVDSVRYAG